MIKFGFSSREYVILHDKSDTSELEDQGVISDWSVKDRDFVWNFEKKQHDIGNLNPSSLLSCIGERGKGIETGHFKILAEIWF